MEYEDIFNKANELIDILSLQISDDLINYITNNLICNGYCSKEGYKDFLNDKY